MTDFVLLSRADVERVLDPAEILARLPEAFVALTDGRSSAPPRTTAVAPDGVAGAMPGYLPGTALEVKITAVFPRAHEKGLPSHQGVITMFDEHDGRPLAMMDAMSVTTGRTAAAAALAARELSRADASVLGILGAGAQAAAHLALMTEIRSFDEIRIASRNSAHAAQLADTHALAVAVDSWEKATREADVVCCCTDAREPILSASWLATGAHVSSIGGTFGHEIDRATVDAGHVFVEWRGAVSQAPPAGAHELQHLDPDSVTELGELLSGTREGRTADDELTVYKSTGHPVEDAVAARFIYERAVAEGIGQKVFL